MAAMRVAPGAPGPAREGAGSGDRALLRRIVRARDEERRRIERDLHDGAQQEILAVMVGLELEAVRADADPALRARLAGLRDQLDGALERIRDLARGVFPLLLDQEGVPAALEAMAARWTPPPTVTCRGVGRYPVEVETAVFFGCAEALQNAARHAGPATAIAVELADLGDALRFEVRDDGAGADLARLRPGRGLTNIAERLEAVGGTLELASEPGRGTRVVGTVPHAGPGA